MRGEPVDSPASLLDALVELFPEFADEVRGEQARTYHQVLQLLAPVVAAFIQDDAGRTKRFAVLVNSMVARGGAQENSVSTCLLEHASQIRIRKLVGPHLSVEAKRQLR